MVLCVVLLATALVGGCAEDSNDGAKSESDLPVEAAAVVDRYFAALNEHDEEAFLGAINAAVYDYVGLNVSHTAEEIAYTVAKGEFGAERIDELAVVLEHTISNTAYVAVSARRPDVEPNPVNGIMVLELVEYPDRGWLVTLDHRFGL